eukprot:5687914-Alexandrium_andersonii.AAC.1
MAGMAGLHSQWADVDANAVVGGAGGAIWIAGATERGGSAVLLPKAWPLSPRCFSFFAICMSDSARRLFFSKRTTRFELAAKAS